MGWERYLIGSKETTWGVKNGGAADIVIPYTDYSVAVQTTSQQAALFCGIRQRKHNRMVSKSLSGALSMPLWAQHISNKSIAEWMLTWATSGPASAWLESWCLELNDEADNKRHLGCRVASATLAGDAEGGVITLAMNLIGKSETGGITPDSLVATDPHPIEFLMQDATLWLTPGIDSSMDTGSDSLQVEMRAFSLAIDNALAAYHTNDQWITTLAAGVRSVNFQARVFQTDDTYDAIRRSTAADDWTAVLQLKGRHGGSAANTYTVVNIDLDRVQFANVTDGVGINQLTEQTLDLTVLKDNSSANDIDITYATSA
jgi:3-deoxy-D-manno-octulosonate 8-phosphate phosphatase KdsC-like HAD superfamily phosphatase